MSTLLTDLQEANASFRCGTCPGGPEGSCDDQCEKHRLEYQAEELGKRKYRKVTECKDCINWLSPFEEAGLNGGHYCDIELQALGILYNCPPTHSCAYGEPKEGE